MKPPAYRQFLPAETWWDRWERKTGKQPDPRAIKIGVRCAPRVKRRKKQ